MTEDERRIITEYIQRVAGAGQAASAGASPWGGRTPSVQPAPNLPPVDREADNMIGQLFQQYPEARYRITQTAFVQEHALVQAQNRIQELEWEVENAQRQAQASQNRGFLGFGGSRPAPMPPRPAPQYPPNYNPQALQQGRGGAGFLGTALTTAAGVAGGMVVGSMLMNAFSGGGGAHAAAASTGGGAFGEQAVPTASAWTDPGSSSAWGGSDAGAGQGQPDATGGGYDSNVSDASGGYDDAGGGGYDDGGSYDDN